MKKNLKKIISNLLSLTILLSFMVVPQHALAATQFSGGTGSAEDPYLISTAKDLELLSQYTSGAGDDAVLYASKHYKLTEDIDFTGSIFNGISGASAQFTGSFDGDYHVLKNITINRAEWGAAFIVYPNNATIKNLGLENISCTSNNNNVGGIAARVFSNTTIENCYVKNVSLSGNVSNMGAITGQASTGLVIKNCYEHGMGSTTANGRKLIGGNDSAKRMEYVYSVDGTYGNVTTRENTVRFNSNGTLNEAWSEPYTSWDVLGDGFKADTKNINGGLPILEWETSLFQKIDSEKVTVRNANSESSTVTIVVAGYGQNDILLGVSAFEVVSIDADKEYEVPYVNIDGALEYRTYVWDNLTSLTPWANVKTYSVN